MNHLITFECASCSVYVLSVRLADMMSIFIRTSSIFSRHALYSPCTYVICRRGLYFVACKRSLQQASIVQFVMAVWLPLVQASLFVLFARWLACGCSHSVCCIIKNMFPHSVFSIAHLPKTVGVVIFCFVRVSSIFLLLFKSFETNCMLLHVSLALLLSCHLSLALVVQFVGHIDGRH